MTRHIVWLHEDALSTQHPVLHGTNEADLVCFIWDDDYLAEMEYGFQRLVFIYETYAKWKSICSVEIPWRHCSNRLEESADTIRVPESPNPTIQANIDALRYTLKVEVVPDEPFVILSVHKSSSVFYVLENRQNPSDASVKSVEIKV